MKQTYHFLALIRQKLFKRETVPEVDTLIEQPEQPQENETVQNKEVIELSEQLCIIALVNQYAEEFLYPNIKPHPAWFKGFALLNEVFVTQGEDPVYRCNMEVFYQHQSGEKKAVYLVSLVRFAGDSWRVFQVKEVMPC